MLKRIVIAVTLAVLAGGLLQVTNPSPAQAYTLDDYYRWKYPQVCVIDKTGSAWPVYSATYRWTKVPDLSFKYGSDCTSKHKRQKIYVYEGWYGTSWHGGAYAYTTCYFYNSSGDYEWLGDGWRAYYCKIWLNNTYRPSGWADRRSVVMHEMGHASALDHTSTYAALMNIYRWRYYDYPTSDDKAGVEARYPW